MMLGLVSHEPHFSLLREEVRFGKQSKRYAVSISINAETDPSSYDFSLALL